MFFSITKQSKENFPNHYRLGELIVNTDNGWHIHKHGEWNIVYKGYVDDNILTLLLPDILQEDLPKHLGNFCVIAYNTTAEIIKIKTDLYRSFPIFYTQKKEVTNLVPLEHTVYTDNVISIDQNLIIDYPLKGNFNVIGDIDTSPLTFNQALDQVDKILSHKIKKFLHYNSLPIKVHLSGGIDSLLVYSYLQKYTDHFEMILAKHFDYDYFYLHNYRQIEKHWGYTQIHHWRTPCVLTSGAPGDEFMLRSPTTADMLLKHQGIKITELLELPQWQDCLHYNYFKLPKNYVIFKTQKTLNCSNAHLTQLMCDIIINDWQHWHIGETLTWTPLRDIEIFKTILRMPINDCIGQIMNSNFSRKLIERNNPSLCEVISNQKNSGDDMKNLYNFLFQ